jgi:CheY-like chemotaxis protein
MARKTGSVGSGRKAKSPTSGGKLGRGRSPMGTVASPELLKRLEAMSQDAYVSPNEAGRILGCTGEAIKQWIYHRRLPAIKLANGFYKIRVPDLAAYVKSCAGAAPRRILLVDSDPATNANIRKTLEDHGFKCILAHNALDALLKAADIIPALLIINASCLGIDWRKLALKIRETKTIKNIPVLLLGSKADAEKGMDWAIELGAVGFLHQPVHGDVLVQEIEGVLGARL